MIQGLKEGFITCCSEYYDWGKAEEELLIGKTNNAGVYIPYRNHLNIA